MNEIETLTNAILNHNLQITVLVAQIETKFPGKTLADLLVEGIFN